MKIFVKNITLSDKIAFEIESSAKILELKELVNQELNIPASDQRYIYAGNRLEDEKTLADYNVAKEDTIHLIVKASEDLPEEQGEEEKNNANVIMDEEQFDSLSSDEAENEGKETITVKLHFENNPVVLAKNKKSLEIGEANDTPTLFKLYSREKKGLTRYGLQELDSKKFIFSPPPFQGIFHGKRGLSKDILVRYNNFGYGEELVFVEGGYIQFYRNKLYWKVEENKLTLVEKLEDASVISHVENI